MRPVLGYTTLYSQRIIGFKKSMPAYLLQYEAHNISISPRIYREREGGRKISCTINQIFYFPLCKNEHEEIIHCYS